MGGKGWLLYGSGKYDKALQAYDKAIKLNPNYPDAWAGKGFALNALDYGEAYDAFDQDHTRSKLWSGVYRNGSLSDCSA